LSEARIATSLRSPGAAAPSRTPRSHRSNIPPESTARGPAPRGFPEGSVAPFPPRWCAEERRRTALAPAGHKPGGRRTDTAPIVEEQNRAGAPVNTEQGRLGTLGNNGTRQDQRVSRSPVSRTRLSSRRWELETKPPARSGGELPLDLQKHLRRDERLRPQIEVVVSIPMRRIPSTSCQIAASRLSTALRAQRMSFELRPAHVRRRQGAPIRFPVRRPRQSGRVTNADGTM